MSIGGSVALIVIGAILRFAVTWHSQYVNIKAIGVIMMIGFGQCEKVKVPRQSESTRIYAKQLELESNFWQSRPVSRICRLWLQMERQALCPRARERH